MNIPILLINLNESKERLEHSRREFLKFGILHFQRMEAVDGRRIAKKVLDSIAPPDACAFYKPLSPGEVGCYLSHVAAAERIVKEGWPYALVFEDDFCLAPDFSSVIEEMLQSFPSNRHLIKLQGCVSGGNSILTFKSGHGLMENRKVPARTISLLWTQEGAKLFLDSARVPRRPIDVQIKYWWEIGLNVSYINPPIVLDGDAKGLTSTIGSLRPRGFMPWIKRIKYQANFTYLSHKNYLRKAGLVSWLRGLVG